MNETGKPGTQRLERELETMLGATPRLPEARLRRVREAVYENLARRETPLPTWLRWRVALPAAASLLLLGGALGWNAETRAAESQDLDLFGAVLLSAPGGTQ